MLIIVFVMIILIFIYNIIPKKIVNENLMIDLSSYSIEEAKKYADENNLKLEIDEIYTDDYQVGKIVKQNIEKDKKISKGDNLIITVCIGTLEDKKKKDIEVYNLYNVNELGRVPVMMYHGIHNKSNAETQYTGGNVDKDGYQRTAEAFRQDLEFYYNNNYRMIRLTDYIDGIIDVEIGKSPIIITFDDGLENNIKVLGLDEKDNLIIDPNCAIGILEEFKKKYPDYNVTATFFVNQSLFNQPKYNEKILNWLVDNGYDIGNHSASHPDFTKISIKETNYQIGSVYEQLNNIIPNKFVKIVALPYGSPYSKTHANFSYIMNSEYNNIQYETKAALRVGWESDYSPFSNDFDPTFIKRIRAYDNDGKEFDIQANFKNLENNRYISDGDKNKIVIKEKDLSKLNNTKNLEVVNY